MCEYGKGMFLHLTALRQDERFIGVKGETETLNGMFYNGFTHHTDVVSYLVRK